MRMHGACIQEGRVSGLEHDMDNMKGWQKSQNGSILRVEEKVDKLVFWQMTTAIGFALTVVGAVVLVYIK